MSAGKGYCRQDLRRHTLSAGKALYRRTVRRCSGVLPSDNPLAILCHGVVVINPNVLLSKRKEYHLPLLESIPRTINLIATCKSEHL
jgi:hypothetical protein